MEDARLLAAEGVSRAALGIFDTVVMCGNNFGLFRGREHTPLLLERFAEILRPGGGIIAES